MNKKIITISRSYGSGGRQVARALAEELGIHYYDKDLISLTSMENGVSVSILNSVDEKPGKGRFRQYSFEEVKSPSSRDYLSRDNLFNMTKKVIEEIADRDESAVIIGRCAHHILKDHPDVLRVFINADQETMLRNAVKYDSVSNEEAARRIEQYNKDRAAYHRYFTGSDWLDVRNYDLCLNTGNISIEQCVEVIRSYIEIMDRVRTDEA